MFGFFAPLYNSSSHISSTIGTRVFSFIHSFRSVYGFMQQKYIQTVTKWGGIFFFFSFFSGNITWNNAWDTCIGVLNLLVLLFRKGINIWSQLLVLLNWLKLRYIRSEHHMHCQGHEERFSIYVHASREKPKHVSPLFMDRDIHSKQVFDSFCSHTLQCTFTHVYII